MRAFWKQRHHHHQIGKREQPLVRALAGCFRGARDEAQVAALRKIMNVLDANSGQVCHFRIGEYFLARFNGNQGLAPVIRPNLPCHTFDAVSIVDAASNTEQ
jgi:hypothetical protein